MQLPEKFSALNFSNYRQYLFGQVISLSGTWMQRMAQAWLIYSLTDSALMVGAVGFVSGMVKVVGGPITGAFADMFERKRLLIWIEIFCMVPTFAFAALFFYERLELWHVFVLTALQGLGAAAEQIARHAIAGDLVPKEHLTSALNTNSSFNNLAKVLGPVIGGFVLYRFGEGMCFFLNGISFLAVIISLMMMKLEKIEQEHSRDVIRKIKEAVSYIYSEKKLLSLFSAVGFIYAMGAPLLIILTVYTKILFVGDANILSYLLTAGAFGGFMGVLFLDHILKNSGLRIQIGAFIAFLGLSYIGLGFSISIPIAIVSSFGIGFFQIGMWPMLNSKIQGTCEESIRGRVISLVQTAIFITIPLAELAAGWLIDFRGAPLTALIFGASSIGVGASLFFLNSAKDQSTERNYGVHKGAAVFATVFICLLVILKSLPQIGPPPLEVRSLIPKVTVATAKKGAFPRTLKIQGETRPMGTTHIYPKVSGFISEMNVNIGEAVKKGQVVAVLDLPETSRELDIAVTQEKIATDYFERLSKMRKGTALDLELEKAKSAIEVAQSNRRQLEIKIQDAEVKAPYDGKITARFVEPGTYAGNELSPRPQPVVTISRQDKLRVYIYVDQKNASKMSVGLAATVKLPENPNVSIETKIEHTAGELEPKSKTLLTELIIDNEKSLVLPNGIVNVEFKIPGEPALQIPSQAVRNVGGKNFVTIVDSFNVIHHRKITVDSIDGDNAYVAGGIKENEMVALGAHAFDDGIKVMPRTEILKVGFLSIGKDEPPVFTNLRKNLLKMGYVDGKNMQIVDESRVEDYPFLPYALERIKEKNVDVLVTFGSTSTHTAIKNAEEIPKVYIAALDLVSEGFVDSFEKPGGTLTGVKTRSFEMGPGRLKTILEIMPEISGVTVLYAAKAMGEGKAVSELKQYSKSINLDIVRAPVDHLLDLEWVIEKAVTDHPKNAMLIMTSTLFDANVEEIMRVLNKYKIPTIGFTGHWATHGALFVLEPKPTVISQFLATDIDRIFKGEYPGNVSIEEANEPVLTLNLNTARTLGVVVPDSVVERAYRIIGSQDSTLRSPAHETK